MKNLLEELIQSISDKELLLTEPKKQRDKYISDCNWDELRKNNFIEIIQQLNEEKLKLEAELREQQSKDKKRGQITYDNQNLISTAVVRRKTSVDLEKKVEPVIKK